MDDLDAIYRSPQAPPGNSPVRIPTGRLRWLYVVVSLVVWVAPALFARWLPSMLPFARALTMVPVFVGLAWVQIAWRDAEAGAGRKMLRERSSGVALLRFFIPVYNVYWAFAAHRRLCGALDAEAREKNLQLRARPDWAFVAMYSLGAANLFALARPTVLAFLLAVVEHVFWFLYMTRVDSMRRALAAVDGTDGERKEAVSSSPE
ncbi:MAG TPA: hypothetical protein VGI39_36440 [Polyangiaceae bacterium]|jgi:hypothetical protein